jgi:DNA-binding response OmpR family regulator
MRRVLSVEDDPVMREIIAATLDTHGGYKLAFAEDGEQGLNGLRRGIRKFDCVLIDVNLPDMTGIDFVRAARVMPDYTDTPMIVVTQSDEETTITEAFMAGATDFLGKPFQPSELIARLQFALARPKRRTGGKNATGSVRPEHPAQRAHAPSGLSINTPAYRAPDIFMNFMHSLNQKQARKTTFVAIDHSTAAALADRLGRRDPETMLSCVVNALSRVLAESLVICTSITENKVMAAFSGGPERNAQDINKLIVDTIRLSHRHADQWAPGIVVGDPVTPSFFSASDPMRLIERAEESANRRREEMTEQGVLQAVKPLSPRSQPGKGAPASIAPPTAPKPRKTAKTS